MQVPQSTFTRLCKARDLLCLEESPLSIREIASQVGLSPFHLIRQFEALFGWTPNQFRTRARLERARHLLASGRYSVTDVCMEVGFSSLGSFSLLFSKQLGVAPSAYARRIYQVPGSFQKQLYAGCFSLMGSLPPSAFLGRRNFREA